MGTTVTLAVEEEGVPVGQVTVELDRYPHAGYLRSLAVAPHAQGRGVGTRLIAWAEQVLAAEGCTQVMLGVEDANPQARALYERLGYHPTDATVSDGDRTCGMLVKHLPG
jgi:ribosomal protein S18 acetylase RimI-like enzyme